MKATTMTQHRLTRRAFLKAAAQVAVSTTLLSTSSLAYAREIEPTWVDITHLRLVLPRLAPAFTGYRLVQISDLHADEWMTRERLAETVALVNQQAPDLVAITGDFVTRRAERYAADLNYALSRLQSRDGTVAVLGNHDHWSNPRIIRQVLQQSGIADVSNSVHTLQRGGAELHMAGVDDVWEEQARLDFVLDRLPATGAAILLAHEPDFADQSAATGRFDLQLSGHSHGGQVALPLLGPPIVPHLAEKYPSGLYQVGTMWQYTNRGLGMARPRVRFNCRPEITVVTLAAPARG